MITTLSKQGGRRYPQMGATGLILAGRLLSVGATVAPTPPPVPPPAQSVGGAGGFLIVEDGKKKRKKKRKQDDYDEIIAAAILADMILNRTLH